jgi:glycosyltransferase involved in cell wall biosynthesis
MSELQSDSENNNTNNFKEFVSQIQSQFARDNIKYTAQIMQYSQTTESSTCTKECLSTFITRPPTRKLNFFIIGTHIHQTTGYAKVMHNLILFLSQFDWIYITHYAIQKPSASPLADYRIYPSSVSVYSPPNSDATGFGFDDFTQYILQSRPDILFIYNDIPTSLVYIEHIQECICQYKLSTKIWLYADIVYKGISGSVLSSLNKFVSHFFVFTEGWRQYLIEEGIANPITVLMHGVDTRIFHPLSKNEARKILQIPQEAVIFFSLNRNTPRKRLDILVQAFARLIAKYPLKPFYLLAICDMGEKGGYPLFDIFARELSDLKANLHLLSNRLLISSAYNAFTDEQINLYYNATDIGVNVADGEGFGLCQFEHMAVGKPQIVSGVGGMLSFCSDERGIVVMPKYSQWLPTILSPLGSKAELVDCVDVYMAMEKYALHEDIRNLHGKRAMEYVGKSECTWESVLKPLVDKLMIYCNFR